MEETGCEDVISYKIKNLIKNKGRGTTDRFFCQAFLSVKKSGKDL